ncbi:E3 ubiquitin-protein ligase-like [Trichomycterus rosablanca]|uniref:E3 ubiquitin-protein ligase-like n=1 Tax=Trichomycterus rosablanca TaxID=2290929 RepID=UPI002F3534B2
MLSELECGICYRIYDVSRRCPRQLHCKHSFCESCLLTLAADQAGRCDPHSGSRIVCAFCRHTSSLTEDSMRDSFPVDEDILERLVAAGVLEESASDDDDDNEEPKPETSRQCEEETLPRTRRGRLWRSIKRFCSKVKGSNRQGCMTNAEMRDLALMACYMM